MNKVRALILTIIAGLVGIYLGAAINLEGYLGIVFAVAVMGYFILPAVGCGCCRYLCIRS